MSRIRLWVPETSEVSIKLPDFSVGVEGHYFIELIDAKTQKVKGTWSFKNLVVNGALDSMSVNSGSSATLTNWAAVGGGSTPPTATDTSLQSEFSGRTNADGGFSDYMSSFSGSVQSGSYAGFRRTRVFSESQGNGTIAEIGFFAASTGNSMFSRALIRDATGSATTITKTSSDQLRVSYDIRFYTPFTDSTGSFTWAGTTYNYTIRPVNVGRTEWGVSGRNVDDFSSLAYSIGQNVSNPAMNAFSRFVLTAFSSSVSGSGKVRCSSTTKAPYITGSFYRDHNHLFEPGVANFPISGFSIEAFTSTANFAEYETFQMLMQPPIVKTNLQRLTMTMRWSIAAL